ncbi:unnamed protein product [Merluccius merluccius]
MTRPERGGGIKGFVATGDQVSAFGLKFSVITGLTRDEGDERREERQLEKAAAAAVAAAVVVVAAVERLHAHPCLRSVPPNLALPTLLWHARAPSLSSFHPCVSSGLRGREDLQTSGPAVGGVGNEEPFIPNVKVKDILVHLTQGEASMATLPEGLIGSASLDLVRLLLGTMVSPPIDLCSANGPIGYVVYTLTTVASVGTHGGAGGEASSLGLWSWPRSIPAKAAGPSQLDGGSHRLDTTTTSSELPPGLPFFHPSLSLNFSSLSAPAAPPNLRHRRKWPPWPCQETHRRKLVVCAWRVYPRLFPPPRALAVVMSHTGPVGQPRLAAGQTVGRVVPPIVTTTMMTQSYVTSADPGLHPGATQKCSP